MYDSDLLARATKTIPRKTHINSSGQRSSQMGPSDPKRVATSAKNSSHIKNYETAIKGIDDLKLKNDDAHQ